MGAADDPRLLRLRSTLQAAALASAPFGCRLDVLDEIDSTNDRVHALAGEDAPEGTVVVARAQRRGRGRRGAAFASPADSGLYLSTLLRPAGWTAPPAERIALTSVLTLLAGVAVVDAVRRLGAGAAELKWPNDVIVPAPDGRWRKLAGVLSEGTSDERGLAHVVVGIGVNVTRTPDGAGLETAAVALRECGAADADVPEAGAAVLASLAEWFARARRDGAFAVVQAWRERAPSTIGRRVSWLQHGRRASGRVRGIDASGALEVDGDDAVERIVAGSVEWDGYGG